MPVETHCHNDLGMAVANSVAGALGDLDAGQDAWINTCVNGIGERSGNADLIATILALRNGFGVADRAEIGDPLDLTWARRFGLWAGYAFGQPRAGATSRASAATPSRTSPASTPTARSRTTATTSCTTRTLLGPYPHDWHTRDGRVVLTGEYGGLAGFRHVMDGLGVEVTDEDLTFKLVQLCNAGTGRPLTDDELRLDRRVPPSARSALPGAARLTGSVIPVR